MLKRRARRILITGMVLGLAAGPLPAAAQSPAPAPPPAPAQTPPPAPSLPDPAVATGAAVPAPPPAAPRSAYITNADADALQETLEDARRADVRGARQALDRIQDPTARKLGLWALMDTNGPSLSFGELERSLRDMADWPRPARRRLAAERLIETSGLSPRQVIAWFAKDPPSTAEGAMALASALRASGDPKAAAELIRQTWRGRPFELDAQRAMMARFGDVLTLDDHVRRADMLLFGAQGPAARDLIALLPPDQQALAQARIAFRQRSPAALALADALPASVAEAPGLAVEKAAHYRRVGLDQLARAEIVRFPREVWSEEMGARIWDERYQLTLSALRNRDSRAAYEAAANTGLQTGPDAVEAEFYAGWIALTRLRDPIRAEAHFKHIDRVGTSPITLARGLYWRGRAVEAIAGIDAADVFYRAAARHRTTFYGQLAAERAGFVRLDLGRDPQIGPQDRARFEARETTRAARILYDIGARDLFRVFVLALDDILDTDADQAMLVDLVRGYGEQDMSMRVVRTAAQRGFILPDRGYPVRTPPEVANAPEAALVLAITRQESGFDPLVRSGVGARGMMQLMPATAAATARRMGVSYAPSLLDDPDYNMRLGSTYLSELISTFAGSYVMAVAGYNAGPGRSTQWATPGRNDAADPDRRPPSGRLHAACRHPGPHPCPAPWRPPCPHRTGDGAMTAARTLSPPRIDPQPTVLRTVGWSDYDLVDSGHGRKLERYGRRTVVRPEPQCLWSPGLPSAAWTAADAVFDPADEEDSGRWRFREAPIEPWVSGWGAVRFHGRFTPFRHLAFFPEQAANWAWLDQKIRSAGRSLNILNLFGYTGVASLVCAAAGAHVTHVDASRKAIGWARENAALSGLADRPIRWICEDARKYVQREIRRGVKYDAIILDPPKYGRGPDGEVWRLFDDLPDLAEMCAALLSPDPAFLLLNAYAERISGAALAGLLADRLEGRGGEIAWGELVLVESARQREIGMSFYARWTA